MRFGCFIPQGWTLDLVGIPVEDHWPTMTRVAKAAEQAGLSRVVFDHFTPPRRHPGADLRGVVSDGGVGGGDRHPAARPDVHLQRLPPSGVPAHVAASIDVISGGRLEMGIGAGWYEEGVPCPRLRVPKASVRIAQLDEGIEVMKRMWTEEKASFEGEYYRLEGAICQPKPLQEPHIPIWVAGGGEKRTSGWWPATPSTPTSLRRSRNLGPQVPGARRALRRGGDRLRRHTRSMNLRLVCAPTEAEAQERLDEIGRCASPDRRRRPERHERQARRWSGPPDKIIEMPALPGLRLVVSDRVLPRRRLRPVGPGAVRA